MSVPKHYLLRLARTLADHRSAVGAAIRLRDGCNTIIGESLSDGIDPQRNGELGVVQALAPQSAVFIDVGANVGDWTELFRASARPGVRGLLIEPSEEAAVRLSERFAAYPELQLRRAAASDQVGKAPFYEGLDASEASSLVSESLRSSERREVELTTLDTEADRQEFSEIDFVKIDAEGHDVHVLRGAGRLLAERRVGALQFEYHKLWAAFGSTLGEAYNLLTRHGYDIYRVRATGLTPATYEPYREFFGYTNHLAVAPHRVGEIQHLLPAAGE